MRVFAVVVGVALLSAGASRAELTLVRARDAQLVDGRLLLLEGGFATVNSGEQSWTCFNALSTPASLSFDATQPALVEPADIPCQSDSARSLSCAREGPPLSCAARGVIAAPLAKERLAVFVLDLQFHDVPEELAGLASDVVTSELARADELQVTSGDDIRRMLEVESTRRVTGCSEEQSCLAEMAGALGAHFLVTGSVSRVERALHVDLSLVDALEASTVARESVQARDVEDLARRLPIATRNLVAVPLATARAPLAPVDLGRRMADGSALGGALLVAGLAAGAAGLSLLPVYSLLFVWQEAGNVVPLTSLGASLLAPLLAGVVAAGASAAADTLAGYPIDWTRAAAASVSGGCALACATPTACVLGLVSVPLTVGLLELPDTDETLYSLLPQAFAITLAGVGVSALLSGTAAGLAYDAGIGLLGDGEPLAADGGDDTHAY